MSVQALEKEVGNGVKTAADYISEEQKVAMRKHFDLDVKKEPFNDLNHTLYHVVDILVTTSDTDMESDWDIAAAICNHWNYPSDYAHRFPQEPVPLRDKFIVYYAKKYNGNPPTEKAEQTVKKFLETDY